MGFLGKLAFWKKEEEQKPFTLNEDLSAPNPYQSPDQFGQNQSFSDPNFGQEQNFGGEQNHFDPNQNQAFGQQQNLGQQSYAQPPAAKYPDLTKKYNPGSYEYQKDPYQAPAANPYGQGSYQQYNNPQNINESILLKDIELISSKIDALRASIDSLNQRVINIEHSLRENRYKW